MSNPNTAQIIAEAARWLEAEAPRVPFGSLTLTLHTHSGKIVKTERHTTVKEVSTQ